MPAYSVNSREWTQIADASSVDRTAAVTQLNSAALRVVSGETAEQDNAITLNDEDGIARNVLCPAGQKLWAKSIERASRVNIEFAAGAAPDGTGWASYNDTDSVEQNPFFLPKNQDMKLPNNGLAGVRSQEPQGIKLYDAGKITGREGDALILTVAFQCDVIPKKNCDLTLWLTIGGGFGPLRPQKQRIFDRDPYPVLWCSGVYTLGVWESNGGDFMVRASQNCNIWDIEYLVHRVHATQL